MQTAQKNGTCEHRNYKNIMIIFFITTK